MIRPEFETFFQKAPDHSLYDDFTFLVSGEELQAMICQSGTSKGRGGRRKPSRVITEQGAIMAAAILNSPRAVAMNAKDPSPNTHCHNVNHYSLALCPTFLHIYVN